MAYRKRQLKRANNSCLHVVLSILTISMFVVALRHRVFTGFPVSDVTMVRREQPNQYRYTEEDFQRLQALFDQQPENDDIPKAIRALKVILFQKWLDAIDYNAMRLDARSVDHKGVFASTSLRAGQTVARVPLSKILTVESIMKTDIGARLEPINPSVHVVVGIFIALQRHNTSSELYPYFRILPDKMDFMPVLSSQLALQSINGTSAWELIAQRKVEIDDEWIRVSPIFPGLRISDFHWGVLVSMSRTAGISINGVTTAGLIPLLNDFRNVARHASSLTATTSAKIVNGYYVISALKAVDSGTELTRNYGSRSAQVFYCDYANVPSGVTDLDSVRLQFSPRQYAAPEAVDVIGNWRRSFLVSSDFRSPSMNQLLSYLRIRVARLAEWERARSSTWDLSHVPFISDDNEQRVRAEIVASLKNLSDSLDCTRPKELPHDASSSFHFAVEQARDMCQLEKNLIDVILERIPELEAMPKLRPTRNELVLSGDPFSDVMLWLTSAGSNLEGVQVRAYGKSYRGLVARRDVGKGQVVMSVPLSHCITSIAAKRTDFAVEARQNNASLTVHSIMAAMLVLESKKPNSDWRHYLATLPKSYRNLPIYYKAKELALLKGTRTMSQLRPNLNEIDEDFVIIKNAAPIASASFTFEEYRMARHAVDCRNFIFHPHGLEKEHMLVPFVDLMNHELVANTAWKFDPDSATFVASASVLIPAGQALITSYGDKSNAQLLIGYGFALPNNSHDKATLRLDPTSMCVVQKTFNTVDMADCFIKLRAIFPEEVDLLEKMKQGAIAGLARFPETIEEDEDLADALLREPDSGDNRVRFCILTRLGEKLVLKFWIETIDTLLGYYAGRIERNQLDPMFEQYFKVLENPELYGSKARGKTGGDNAP